LAGEGRVLDRIKGDTLEIVAEFEPGDAKEFGVKLRRSEDGKRAVVIRSTGRELDVAGTRLPLRRREGEKTVRLHVFLDRSVLEVYVNQRECVTRVIHPDVKDLGVEVFATGGGAVLEALDAWQMQAIW
jgi:beta-fructofuranosidase